MHPPWQSSWGFDSGIAGQLGGSDGNSLHHLGSAFVGNDSVNFYFVGPDNFQVFGIGVSEITVCDDDDFFGALFFFQFCNMFQDTAHISAPGGFQRSFGQALFRSGMHFRAEQEDAAQSRLFQRSQSPDDPGQILFHGSAHIEINMGPGSRSFSSAQHCGRVFKYKGKIVKQHFFGTYLPVSPLRENALDGHVHVGMAVCHEGRGPTLVDTRPVKDILQSEEEFPAGDFLFHLQLLWRAETAEAAFLGQLLIHVMSDRGQKRIF